MLRHSPAHLGALTESGVLSKVIELYGKAANAEQVNFYNNLLKKAGIYNAAFQEAEKKKLKNIVQTHIDCGRMRADNDNVRRLQQLFA
jgi:hypothetical protein